MRGINPCFLRPSVFEEFSSDLGEQRIGKRILRLLLPFSHSLFHLRKLRVKEICRPAGNGILLVIPENLVNDLLIEGLYGLSILAEQYILCLLSSNLVPLAHQHVEDRLSTDYL